MAPRKEPIDDLWSDEFQIQRLTEKKPKKLPKKPKYKKRPKYLKTLTKINYSLQDSLLGRDSRQQTLRTRRRPRRPKNNG